MNDTIFPSHMYCASALCVSENSLIKAKHICYTKSSSLDNKKMCLFSRTVSLRLTSEPVVQELIQGWKKIWPVIFYD